MSARDFKKHDECKHECQQAVAYGVWPEHSCSPRCVWLDHQAQYQQEQIYSAQSEAAFAANVENFNRG